MVEVKAIVREERFEDVLEALRALPGMPGVTVSRVLGYGRPRAAAGETVAFGQVPMVKVEAVVPRELGDAMVDAIRRVGNTGRAGDGKIFVIAVERAVRIRNGEEGLPALS